MLLLHELEEWNIYEYHQATYVNKILGETKLSGRLWLILLSNALSVSIVLGMLLLLLPGLVDSAVNSRRGKLPKMVEMILVFSTRLEGLFTK